MWPALILSGDFQKARSRITSGPCPIERSTLIRAGTLAPCGPATRPPESARGPRLPSLATQIVGRWRREYWRFGGLLLIGQTVPL
jgi:hypothetical protein